MLWRWVAKPRVVALREEAFDACMHGFRFRKSVSLFGYLEAHLLGSDPHQEQDQNINEEVFVAHRSSRRSVVGETEKRRGERQLGFWESNSGEGHY